MSDAGKGAGPCHVGMGCTWRVDGVQDGGSHGGLGGAGVTTKARSEVCGRGLPNNGIKDPTALFVSLNMNEEPGHAPGGGSAGMR